MHSRKRDCAAHVPRAPELSTILLDDTRTPESLPIVRYGARQLEELLSVRFLIWQAEELLRGRMVEQDRLLSLIEPPAPAAHVTAAFAWPGGQRRGQPRTGRGGVPI